MPITRYHRWIRRAAKQANTNLHPGYRLGAVAVRGGKVIGFGANKHRNDPCACPGVPRPAWSIHAEDACLKGIANAQGATLYVARITKSGTYAMARPCNGCWEIIRAAGVERVVYTTGNGVAVERAA